VQEKTVEVYHVGDLVKISDTDLLGYVIQKTKLEYNHISAWYCVDFFDESEIEPRWISGGSLRKL
jgi:hypothetical protein